MPTRRTAAVLGTLVAILASTGCSATDDLFSNLDPNPPITATPSTTAGFQPPAADAPPNYADNNRVRHPRSMSFRDRQEAERRARSIQHALRVQQERGQITPEEVRPVLERLARPGRLVLSGRMVGTALTPAEGSDFGIFVGDTACVTGAVSTTRIWIDVNGHYPETGCTAPPPTH
ncbi:hypothetical protein [Streptomyces sp. NPDC046939]|uniref:hypothetical protein n=1 Tax=Streptomyces sp. NPDC046939 TaxID=3155376 RepID=UPI0033C99562